MYKRDFEGLFLFQFIFIFKGLILRQRRIEEYNRKKKSHFCTTVYYYVLQHNTVNLIHTLDRNTVTIQPTL